MKQSKKKRMETERQNEVHGVGLRFNLENESEEDIHVKELEQCRTKQCSPNEHS
jgi:hypothetical protein